MYGGFIASHLKKKLPQARLLGIGGSKMEAAGVLLQSNIDQLAVVGVYEVLVHLKVIYQVFSQTRKWLKKERPDLIILIDYPDFNFLIARAAKRMGLKVIYYISPQVWAWRKRRVKKLAQWIKLMIVVFPFEVPIYEREGVPVSFAGHPLVDLAVPRLSGKETVSRLGFPPDKRIVALLPGSRQSEIKSLLIPLLKGASLLAGEDERLHFAVPVAESLNFASFTELFHRHWKADPSRVSLIEGYSHEILNTADFAITASGTATLEAALFGVPMVIVYQVSPLTFNVGKLLVKVDHIGMVNIVAGKRIVPELIQHELTPENIAGQSRRILNDSREYRKIKRELAAVKEKLGSPGVLERTTEIILKQLLDPEFP